MILVFYFIGFKLLHTGRYDLLAAHGDQMVCIGDRNHANTIGFFLLIHMLLLRKIIFVVIKLCSNKKTRDSLWFTLFSQY